MAKREKKSGTPKPMRFWPGVVLAILLVLIRFVVLLLMPMALGVGILGGAVGSLLIFIWWIFFRIQY